MEIGIYVEWRVLGFCFMDRSMEVARKSNLQYILRLHTEYTVLIFMTKVLGQT